MNKVSIGYALSSEEQTPRQLIDNARLSEKAGFDFISISDHFHPWTNSQGQSPFIWTILGGIAEATEQIPIMTGVTAPIIRIHPVILAQATATTAALLEGRFLFGVGSGENLNEHVVGLGWPNIKIRHAMLRESIEIIRELWNGKLTNIHGSYYTVDQARIYTLPEQRPPIIISALGPKAARLAGEIGDGLVTTSPNKAVLDTFDQAGGKGKPKYIQVTVCYDTDEQRAKETAAKIWPNAVVSGQASQELPMPLHFEQLAKEATPDKISEMVVCGPDKQQHIEQIQQCINAGFSHVYIHQVGQNQAEFIKFYQEQIIPEFR